MDRQKLRKLIQGPLCTLPTPFDDDFRIDHGRMRELVRWLISEGLGAANTVLKVAVIGGEGPTLTDDEWPALLRTVIQAADGKAPVMQGISYKDTFRAIEDAKRAQDIGAIGLQVSPPILSHPNQDDHLRHYEAISDAIEIGIMLYNTPWYTLHLAETYGEIKSIGSVHPDTIVKMADFEHVVAIKWSVSDEYAYEEMSRFSHIFNVLDNNTDPILCHKLGGRGYIGSHQEMYPPLDFKIWELLESKQYDEAEKMYDSTHTPERAAFSDKVTKRSGGRLIRMKKGMMTVMGQDVGPPRPPTLPLSNEELDELREVVKGFGWPVPEPTWRTAAAV